MGKIQVKMSKEDAIALTRKAYASTLFARAIAKTINVPASDVVIIAIYVDQMLVGGSRRLTSESTVRVDLKIKAADINVGTFKVATLKTNIEAHAKFIGLFIAITAPPEVAIPDRSVLASTPEQGLYEVSSASTMCLAGLVSSLLMSVLLL